MKAALPAAVCFVGLLYCFWRVYRSENQGDLKPATYSVEVVVRGPDGEIIPAVAPAPKTVKNP